MEKDILSLYKSGKIFALSMDTSYLESRGYKFSDNSEYSLLSYLDKKVKIIISDVVDREFTTHINAKAADSKKKLTKAIREAKNDFFLGNPEALDEIKKIVDGIDSQEALKPYSEFKKKNDVEIISSAIADNNAITEAYFNETPPFSGRKKSEFPDAYILESLKSVTPKGMYTILIAKDGDHIKYNAHNIIVLEDITRFFAEINNDTYYTKFKDEIIYNIINKGKIYDEMINCIHFEIDFDAITFIGLGGCDCFGEASTIDTIKIHADDSMKRVDLSTTEMEIEFIFEVDIYFKIATTSQKRSQALKKNDFTFPHKGRAKININLADGFDFQANAISDFSRIDFSSALLIDPLLYEFETKDFL